MFLVLVIRLIIVGLKLRSIVSSEKVCFQICEDQYPKLSFHKFLDSHKLHYELSLHHYLRRQIGFHQRNPFQQHAPKLEIFISSTYMIIETSEKRKSTKENSGKDLQYKCNLYNTGSLFNKYNPSIKLAKMSYFKRNLIYISKASFMFLFCHLRQI